MEQIPTGNIKCTEVMNRLIDSLAVKGGAHYSFRQGHSSDPGPIAMKSNTTLYIDAGSTIKFVSDDF